MNDLTNDKFYAQAKECAEKGDFQKAKENYNLSLIQYRNADSAYELGKLYKKHYLAIGLTKEIAIEEARWAFSKGVELGCKKSQREFIISLYKEEPKNLKEAIRQVLILNEYNDTGIKRILIEVLGEEQSQEEKVSFLESCLTIVKERNGKKTTQDIIKALIVNNITAVARRGLQQVQTQSELKEGERRIQKYKKENNFIELMQEHIGKKASILMRDGDVNAINELLAKIRGIKKYNKLEEDITCWLARSYWQGNNGAKQDRRKAIKYYKRCSPNDVQEEVLCKLNELVENQEHEEAVYCAYEYSTIVGVEIKKRSAIAILYQKLKKLGFEGFLHTTEIDNFKSIVNDGALLPRSYLESKKQDFRDSANLDVVEQTKEFVKQCCRFFYYFKTPTNHEAHYRRPVIIVFSQKLMYDKRAIYVSTSAAKENAQYTRNPCRAVKEDFVPWEAVFERKQYSMSPYYQKTGYSGMKGLRNTEFLIQGEVPVENITKVYFRNIEDMQEAQEFCDKNLCEKFEIKREKFDD